MTDLRVTSKPALVMEANEIDELKRRAAKSSLAIGLIYVGLGTITAMSVYPGSPLYGDWIYLGLLLTLPVSVTGFAVMYAKPDVYLLVLVVQTIMFFIFWLVLYRYLLKRYAKQLR